MGEFSSFILLVVLSLVLPRLPWVHAPFSWLETFFHELSHGLAAMATGGKVVNIRLRFDGSGSCLTQGGWRFPILLAGYGGAVGWGVVMYAAARQVMGDGAKILTLWLLTVLVGAAFLWIRDGVSFVIVAVMVLVWVVQLKVGHLGLMRVGLQFAGVYVVTSAIRAPLALFYSREANDGACLASLTRIPEIVWIGGWFFLALFGLWSMGQSVDQGMF